MVWKLYKQYAHPLARVVCGLPISWRSNFATTRHPNRSIRTVAWSSCSKFIAVGLCESTEVLDAVTLERLHNFTHPEFPSQTGWLSFSPDGCSLTRINSEDYECITWDLRTGGRISTLPSLLHAPSLWGVSSIYSTDGNTVAVAACCHPDDSDAIIPTIFTYNLILGTHVDSHHFPGGHTVAQIWTHGEFLRFATVKPGSITIWEVGSTSEHTLVEIESLPAPNDTNSKEHLFLPTLSRLAFIFREAVLIWDTRDSKFLLNFVGGSRLRGFSFSPDGRFFACGAAPRGFYLWKESPTGYVLHQELVSNFSVGPLLSPDGESIITSKFYETQLWRTTDLINPPSSVPPQPAEQTDFVLAFSPDKSFIATGRLGESIATLLLLASGRLSLGTYLQETVFSMPGRTFMIVSGP